MIMRKYTGDSLPEIYKQIEVELGKDALIHSPKIIKTGGFLGMFKTKKYEVTAQIDSVPQNSRNRGKNGASPVASGQRPYMNGAAANSAYSANSGVSPSLKEQAEAILRANRANEKMDTNAAETPTKVTAGNSAAATSSATAVAEAVEPVTIADEQAPKAEEKADDKTKNDSVLSEIRQMKEMIVKLNATQTAQAEEPASLRQIVEHLENQEFDSALIEEIMFHVRNDLEAEAVSEPDDQLVKTLVRKHLEDIVYRNGVETISPDTRIVHFVGPTGVGKTTTIAKLAARQVLEHRRKVGFITADTYRIAAVEQLRTYARILDAPLEVVMSPQDLARAYESMKDFDLVFMDTAGRNFRNEMYVSELNTMLNSSDQSETYLVLSMTMKYKDMKTITENFSRIRIDRLLFSKLDETASYGAIVNLIHQFSIPLSYFTHGQQVPNDIEEVKKDVFISRLMGEDVDE